MEAYFCHRMKNNVIVTSFIIILTFLAKKRIVRDKFTLIF